MTRQGSPRLWIRHAGRPQWIRLWIPRWWRRHAGRLQPLVGGYGGQHAGDASLLYPDSQRGGEFYFNCQPRSSDIHRPLPLDQLICYSADTVQSWPTEDRDQILAVASRDLTVARRNLAELTRYVDIHAAHLATCTGGSDDSIPLMAAETYPRLPGGIGRPCKKFRGNEHYT